MVCIHRYPPSKMRFRVTVNAYDLDRVSTSPDLDREAPRRL